MAKILVADDEPMIRALLSRQLAEAGHEVVEAADGPAAVEQVQIELPDLVLLDVLMPMMTGLQVLNRWRGDPVTQELPVILLTSFAIDEVQPEVLEVPNTYHVIKPWRRGVVESAVESVLAGRPPENEHLGTLTNLGANSVGD